MRAFHRQGASVNAARHFGIARHPGTIRHVGFNRHIGHARHVGLARHLGHARHAASTATSRQFPGGTSGTVAAGSRSQAPMRPAASGSHLAAQWWRMSGLGEDRLQGHVIPSDDRLQPCRPGRRSIDARACLAGSPLEVYPRLDRGRGRAEDRGRQERTATRFPGSPSFNSQSDERYRLLRCRGARAAASPR